MILFWLGRVTWNRYTARQSREIRTAASPEVHYVDLEEVNELPQPVQRFFHLVLKDGAAIINRGFITQTGGFRARPETQEWSKMEAKQCFSARPRAFVWEATISIGFGLSIRVCDSYSQGKGRIKAKLVSLFTVVDAHNQKELNEAALQRYLAESVWFPTALLPSQGVTWQRLDDSRAQATITDSNISTSVEFEFNDRGEAISVYSPSRYKEVSGKYERTPWKGRFSKYKQVNDYLIPQEGVVEWHLKDRIYPYWKARLGEIRYE